MTKTMVLVHGAFGDQHAFDAVAPLVRDAGYRVVTLDLPGHGSDSTSPNQVTLQTYVDAVGSIVNGADQFVLVGHSMAGMVVSQVAESLADRVRSLVYIAAYLPQDGQSLQQLAETDSESLVGRNMEFAPDYSTATIRKDSVVEAIAADLSPELQKIIVDNQKPEPLRPFQEAVHLSAGRFGRVRKAYLRTGCDRAVTPSLQSRMLAAYPNMPTTSLPTSHLPFLAQPQECAKALVALAEQAR